MNYEYIFRLRWLLGATPEEVYAALVDFDLYTQWGYPAYLAARRHGEPVVGSTADVTVQGSLPYKLNLHARIMRLQPGREIAIAVEGDVTGEKVWTMRPLAGGTELIEDWRCNTSSAALRALTPIIKPLFRWNHDQCMQMAISGLAQYLDRRRTEQPLPRASKARAGRRPRSEVASAR